MKTGQRLSCVLWQRLPNEWSFLLSCFLTNLSKFYIISFIEKGFFRRNCLFYIIVSTFLLSLLFNFCHQNQFKNVTSSQYLSTKIYIYKQSVIKITLVISPLTSFLGKITFSFFFHTSLLISYLPENRLLRVVQLQFTQYQGLNKTMYHLLVFISILITWIPIKDNNIKRPKVL